MSENSNKIGLITRICKTKSGRMLVSALLTLALVGLTAALFPITFLTNDDTSIMYTLAGYFTGNPYPIHGFISLPLGLSNELFIHDHS